MCRNGNVSGSHEITYTFLQTVHMGNKGLTKSEFHLYLKDVLAAHGNAGNGNDILRN